MQVDSAMLQSVQHYYRVVVFLQKSNSLRRNLPVLRMSERTRSLHLVI
ncbi:hypothetical protein CEXT_715501, partial [Caerostris extrusa]